jgi:hypothetical protein
MMRNKIKKLQEFISKPQSITITNTIDVSVLVLNACLLSAIHVNKNEDK